MSTDNFNLNERVATLEIMLTTFITTEFAVKNNAVGIAEAFTKSCLSTLTQMRDALHAHPTAQEKMDSIRPFLQDTCETITNGLKAIGK